MSLSQRRRERERERERFFLAIIVVLVSYGKKKIETFLKKRLSRFLTQILTFFSKHRRDEKNERDEISHKIHHLSALR